MKKIIILLCLSLIGCATVCKEDKASGRPLGRPGAKAVTETDQKGMDSIIAMFSDAIKKNPDYAGAYYNRGMTYFYKHEYEQSLQDMRKAEELGVAVDQKFIKSIEKLSKSAARKK
ncbi:MAG: hypothetical protein PHO03_01980 [Candidatus Omnitrophica bacterium]|nr:hypothetical protein [Candidatus Omnitrophota bacterium]